MGADRSRQTATGKSGPPKVEYDLTSTGEQPWRRLEPLLQWIEEQEDGT